eukprot:TRINITY_DN22488_c0_g5_i1.p1 TRINITY_DN22488_c0_g5~~TRINITY_DN22488_c0_g5_i1.p1  ORF type:complete len:137 (-),score=30.98 TRINITY_DN22488_c0_g5_i1:72-482(-)
MAPKRRLSLKGPETPAAKRAKAGEPAASANALAAAEGRSSGESAIVEAPKAGQLAHGEGRGLKAVQSSREMSKSSRKVDGTTTEKKSKVKEQKLFKASSKKHVETKVMTEDNVRTTKKDGTVVITSSTTMKKVSYL